ncbi:MAG: hypothetical protein IJU78_06560, partial [Clostridia bacterium]|nr:hypothetical protein [Clostridia bacterium]
SKEDCELACDEGALARLGEGERLAYGETLLALVPMRHGSRPMLTATTMTAGKRQMKERISRIAAHKRPVMAAVLPAALLLAGACALTFTAAKQPETCPLTAEELKYFSESFFSSLKDGINLRNQFLGVLYEKPEDIDLFELFYVGTGTYNVVLPEDPEYPLVGTEICDTTRMPTAELDAAFYAATGVHIEQTKKKGLDNFRYLPEYDAYYHTHGDTNYFGCVEIAAGMREGKQVRLWYFDAFRGGGWKCVTLRETAEGGWHFVSNLKAEKPIVPTVYPEGEPWAVLPTDGMEPRLAADIGEAADEDIYHIDLDGDGADELISGSKLLLERGGLTYEADIRELISTAFGNTDILWESAYADRYRRCIVAEGVVQRGQYNWPTFRRYIYFNDESLLIYKADITHTNNIMDGVSAPAEVLRDAGAEAKAAAWRLMARDSRDAHEWLDDWCVSALELTEVRRESYTVEIYSLGVLFHASDPQKVVLAGGMGLTEDDWVSGVSEAPAFLIYAVTPDGARRRLDADITWEMGPQNETAFPMELAYVELMNGLCKPSELSGTELARLFIQRWYDWDDIMNWMGAAGEAEYTDAIRRMINAAEENGEQKELERAVFLRFAQSSLPNLTDEGKKANRYMTELVMPTQTE